MEETFNERKRIVYLLFVSLAINLVFIGGLGFRAMSFAERNHRPISSNLGWAIRGLSAERSNQLMSSLNLPVNNQNLSIAAARSNMIKAQRDANEVMRSPNFQEDTLRDALSALRTSNMHYQELSHEQMTLLFSKMTDQERKAASDFLNRIGPRRSQGRPPGPFPNRGVPPRPPGPFRPN